MRGKVKASTLTDIANAIRYQSGGSATMTPAELGPAVAALDSSADVPGQQRACPVDGEGMVSEACLMSVADALRAQTGFGLSYLPREMAPAILALRWDSGLKLRALLLDDGTFEITYKDRPTSTSGGAVTQSFEIDPNGYTTSTARPWDSVKLRVRKVRIDGSVRDAGLANCAYWFLGMTKLVEVNGFENLTSLRDATQMFNGCASLESIFATSFTGTFTASASMFYGCNRLVGGTDGFVPTTTSSGSVCKLGAGGVLTNPNNDRREWMWAHFYDDGGAVISWSGEPDASRTLLASAHICANAHYPGTGFTPWDSSTATHRSKLTSVEFASDLSRLTYVNLSYMFYTCTNLKTVTGLGRLPGARELRYAFASTAIETLDIRGLNDYCLTDLYHCFSKCTKLRTIYADSWWSLPTSGITGTQCFYNCPSLVGGNGTVWTSNNTSYTFMQIDRVGQMGYLTSARRVWRLGAST